MKRILLYAFLVMFVGCVGKTFHFLYKRSQKPPTVFETEVAKKQDIVKKTVATGDIVPRQEVEIKPRVSGVLDEIYVEPNTIVKQGEKIAKIKIVPNAQSLNQAESAVRSARIAFDNAKRELDRNQALYAQGVIPEAELARFQTEFALRKQDFDTAGANLQIVREGQTRGGGAASNVIVTSTVDGMVIDVPVKVGFSVIESNNFNPGTTIATVADMNDMIFQGQVDESEVGKIKKGMPLRIKIGALESEQFEGTLEYIAPKGKEIDGAIQFEIKATLIRKEGVFIRAGYSANADVVLDEKKQVLAIREAVVQYDPAPPGTGSATGATKGKPFVEVETEKQKWARREVELGLSDGINVEIVKGVTEADKIKVPANAGPPGMPGGPRGGGAPRRR
jgi:HlyD family secretion protein